MSFSGKSESENADNSELAKSIEYTSQEAIQPSEGIENSDENLNTTQLKQRSQNFVKWTSGPIPTPETLQEYNQVVSGFAEKFLDSFLEESKHRRQLESKLLELDQEELRQQGSLIDKNHQRSLWGLAAGFIISLSALGSAVYVTVQGQPWVGGVIGGTTAVGLAGVFVIGKLKEQTSDDIIKSQKDEDEATPPEKD